MLRIRVIGCRGQALPEMIIVFPLAIIIIMSAVQLGLLYRAKAAQNNATFLAARAGSLDNGFTSKMRTVFLDRMAALGKIDPGRKDNGVTERFFDDPSMTRLELVRKEMSRYHKYEVVEIVSPSKAVFNHFALPVNELVACSGSDCPSKGSFRLSNDVIMQIPNNNLDARDRNPYEVEGHHLTLQDANLLSVRTRFCYELEVPVANYIIWRSYGSLFSDIYDYQLCQQQLPGRYAIPIVGHSIVRMQSPVRCEGDLDEGRNCENLR